MERREIHWGSESTKIVHDDHGEDAEDAQHRAQDRRQSADHFVPSDDEPSTLECIYD
jgi:hypothetical protein